jgi:hypothetical protein
LQVLLAILTGQPVAHTDAPTPRPSLSPAGAAMEVNDMTLAHADAAEPAEMLQFLSDWLARERDHLEASLEGIVGNCTYGTGQLRDDLARFIFLPDGSDGEPLFGQQQSSTPALLPERSTPGHR